MAVESIIDHRVLRGSHEYLLRNNSRLNNEDDFWVSLRHISTSLDPFIERFHEIHWDHMRPSLAEMSANSRFDKGLTAQFSL